MKKQLEQTNSRTPLRTQSRKKSQSAKDWLKIEITGLLLLAFTALALAGFGPVGKGIDYLFILFAGYYYAAIGIILGYVALYLIIKQTVPPFGRRSIGVLLLVVVCLGWSTLNLYHDISLGQSHQETSMTRATMERVKNLNDVLSGNAMTKSDLPDAYFPGGGLIGLVVFSLFHSLFDVGGTIFFYVILAVIGCILTTGLSFSRAWQLFSGFLSRRFKEITAGMQAIRETRRASGGPRSAASEKSNSDSKTKKKTAAEETVTSNDNELLSESAGEMQETLQPVFPNIKPLTIRDFSEAISESAKTEPFLHRASDNMQSVSNETDADTVDLAFVDSAIENELYELPSTMLLDLPKTVLPGAGKGDIQDNVQKLESTLESFGVHVKVTDVHRGPTVTRYELTPAIGVKVSKIVSLTDDLALALAAKDIRIEAPIPGKSAVGIEVPNKEVATVTLREVIESSQFQNAASKLTVVLGRDISGTPIVGNLAKMPHLLVAGATGSGKSVCINGIITSILYKAKPNEVKFIMVDPKMVELNVYNGIPHLMAPVVTDPRRAAYALKKVVAEMEHRYELFAKEGARNIEGYNQLMADRGQPQLPLIVVIIDELADLMMVAPGDVEDAICRLAQMARAAGIHLIIATQRPSVDVITGVIKANIPSRIAFAVSSQVDSRTILDGSGAEKLLGRGDMLYLPIGESKPIRVQGAFLSDGEVERIVTFVKEQSGPSPAQYTLDLSTMPEQADPKDTKLDDLFWEAVKLVVENEQASVSLLQRRLKVGYSRAARLVDQMEEQGFVGPFEGSKPREVLLTKLQWETNYSQHYS